ncbi:MAG: flagellar hook-basal body complex protein FliE [Pseudomonadota bacterium]
MDMTSTLAAKGYGGLPGVTPATAAPPGDNPGEALLDTALNFAETLREGEETAKASMIGEADPQALVQALAASQLAVETAITVRDRVVEAYQEILRMPV